MPGEALPRRQLGKACRSSSYAKRAGAAVGRGAPSMHPARRAAATGRREAPLPTLPWCAAGTQFVRAFSSNWSVDKPQCHG